MIAAALGPGRGVFSSGAAMASSLSGSLALPARAARAVFEQDAPRGEVVANAIGLGKVAAPPGGMPRLDQLLDLRSLHRRMPVLRAAQADDAEHAVKQRERLLHHAHVAGAEARLIH